MSRNRKSAEQNGFDGLGKITSAGKRTETTLEGPAPSFSEHFDREHSDWAKDAEWSIVESREPGARGLLYVVLLVFVLLLLWASFARVEEVTRGEGRVIPSDQLQVVQSPDGGQIRALNVEEGQVVEKGQLLVTIDPTRFVATERETRVRIFSLQARVARLQALLEGNDWAPEKDKKYSPEEARVIQRELAYFEESRQQLEQQLQGAREQLDQRLQLLEEARARQRSAARSRQLVEKELELTRPLLKTGAVSEVEIFRLERDYARAEGEQEQAEAEVAQRQSGVEEARAKIEEIRHQARNQWRSELGQAASELQGLEESAVALVDIVKGTRLRSPVSGTVQRVLYNTPGAVVGKGDPVVEIVPDDDQLVVEAKIAPRDIAFLKPGLPATIKLHAYDFAIYGGVQARLEHISADSIVDRNEKVYYLVRASTDTEKLADHLEVMPGMTAQLDIITGDRTVLSYLLKPILRAQANAFGER